MAYDDRALRGVGGWLAFFVLTLAVFGPLRGAVGLHQMLSAPTPPPFADGWPAFRVVAVVEFLAGNGLAWFLAWRLVRVRNRATPRIVVVGLWAAALLLQPLMVALGIAVSSIPMEMFLVESGRSLAQGVGYALVWTLYLRNSVRVANTYASDEADGVRAVFE